MAVGGGQGIGRIKELGHILLVKMEHALQHPGHLLLAGGTGSGYGHLYLHGSILGDGHAVVYGSGYCNALRTAELEHGLHVLAKERGLDCHLIGQIGVNYAVHALEYMSQFKIHIVLLTHIDNAHGHYLRLLILHFYNAVAHDVGSRVNAQNDFLSQLNSHLPKFSSAKIAIIQS